MSDTGVKQTATSSLERFGDYVLVEKIAQGGMAELFLAKRQGAEGFEKIVAIKRILPELSWNPDFVTMFINEAKIAARLSHPNIVQIFDFGKIENYYFIAMEYVHGENLRTILKRAAERRVQMPNDLAAHIVARASAGLEHAHKKMDERGKPLRIIHRDVSPQNVLVSYEGEVKVVDFGIAKAIAESPEATRGVLKGKLNYLSPEQVMGKNLDPRTDVFAVGLVFYELLTGNQLFDQVATAEILDAIMHVDSAKLARELPRLHKALREVLRRGLHPEPDQRFASAGDMQRALEDYLRQRGDTGGTLQLTNYMRLLFDDKIGASTMDRLRKEVLGEIEPSKPGMRRLPALSPRLLAALGGAAVGVVALAIAAPGRRSAVESPPAKEPPVGVERRQEPPSGPATDGGGAEIARATQALAAGNPAGAVAGFEKAFELSPGLRERNAPAYAQALSDDGKRLFREGSEQAAERFEAALRTSPELFDPHFYLAKIYTGRKDVDAAQREYGEAIRINPKSADAQFNLGFIYFSQKRYEEALRQYEKVVELKPPYLADVFYNIAACYEQAGKKPEAVQALRQGLDAVPDSELLRQRLKQLGG